MPTYKFSITEMMFRRASDVEIEAESLKDAMAQLAECALAPDCEWQHATREMMVLELSVVDDDDEEVILEDTRTRENGTFEMWPMHMVEDGRVWEGDFLNDGEYDMEDMPRRVRDLIEEEEDQAE